MKKTVTHDRNEENIRSKSSLLQVASAVRKNGHVPRLHRFSSDTDAPKKL